MVICFQKNLIYFVQLKISKEERGNFIYFEVLAFHWNRKFRMKHNKQDEDLNSNLEL